jgi:hypothetical protein
MVEAVNFIAEYKKKGEKVYVHCKVSNFQFFFNFFVYFQCMFTHHIVIRFISINALMIDPYGE